MGKYDDKVGELFTKHVKPMKLPPRLAGQIKHAMEAAAKSSKGDSKLMKKAITEYLTERGYDADSGKKLKKAKKVKAEKPAKAAKPVKEEKPKKKRTAGKDDADPVKEKLEKAGAKAALKGDADNGVPKGNVDLRKLERKTLKGMAKDLGASYSKEMSDDELRASVAKKMVGIDSKALEKLSKADPVKIEALDDCVGLMLDLTKAVCITCPAQEDCRKLFEQHREEGFKIFDTIQTTEGVQIVPVANLSKKEKAKKDDAITIVSFSKVKKLPKVEVDGEAVESNMEHKEFLRDLKTEKPATMSAFRALVEKHYEADDAIVAWFTKYTKALGVIASA
jgi:hypothetical protein